MSAPTRRAYDDDYDGAVSTRSAALRNELMALPVEDRAELAVQLLASLDERIADSDPAELDRTWGAEMVRRSEQVASGEAETVTWGEVLARVAEHRSSR